MTALLAAAVAGRGLVDPAAPVFYPDDEALLRGAAAFETVRIRGGRPVLPARRTSSGSSARALASGCRRPTGRRRSRSQAVEAAGGDEGVLRLFRTARTLLATVAPLPAGLAELRARGLAIVTVRSHDAGLLTGVKATSYATALAAIAAGRAARRRRRALPRRGRDGARGDDVEHLVARRRTSSSPRRSRRASCPASPGARSPRLARRAGYRLREGSFTLPALLNADEAFTSSAVREIMPVIAIDGRELRRGEAAGTAPGAARAGARRVPFGDGQESDGCEQPPRRSGSAGWRSRNGVLVHGPTSWACAVRTDDGAAQGRRRAQAADRLTGHRSRLLRGPARLAESFAVLPRARSAPCPRRGCRSRAARVVASMAGAAVALARRAPQPALRRPPRSWSAACSRSRPRCSRCAAARSPAYHGAEHIAIGSYEHGEPDARKEHERCGVAPGRPAARDDRRSATCSPRARPTASGRRHGSPRRVGAVAASTEIFGWMQANPERRLARALARPGHEFQHRLATAEPSPEQLEVAEAALAACLELERSEPLPL